MSSSIFGYLESSLHGYLVDLAGRVHDADDSTAAHLARSELPRIAAALQAVLDEHRPDEQGRCGTCRTRRFTRSPAPCRAYLTAHLCLLVNGAEQAPAGGAVTAADLQHHLGAPG